MKKSLVILLIILILIGTGIYYFFAVKIEYSKNKLVQENYNSGNYGEIYSYYFVQKPMIENRPIVGDESAPLTFTVITDFYSPTMKQFFDEKLSWLKEGYVDNGAAKIKFKYYITEEEYNEKKGRFIYGYVSYCYTKLGGKNQYDLIYDLLSVEKDNIEEIYAVTNKNGISKSLIQACMTQEPPKTLYEDMLETKSYRIVAPSTQISIEGEDSTPIYVGTSSQNINNTIRSKQIRIGI